MLLSISADLTSSFGSAWDSILTVFYDVISSIFSISIGGVSLGVIWLSLNIMLTVIAVTLTVVKNGASNTVNTGTYNRREEARFERYKENQANNPKNLFYFNP